MKRIFSVICVQIVICLDGAQLGWAHYGCRDNLPDDFGERNDIAECESEKTRVLQGMLHDRRIPVGAKTMQPNPNYSDAHLLESKP